MESFARLVRLHSEFRQRRGPVSAAVLQERLDCSRPTLFRALAHLRDVLGAPVVNLPGRGYAYDRTLPEFELPGFWLSADELHALVVMDELLKRIQPGILHEHVRPWRARIDELLQRSNRSHQTVPAGRVRLLQQHARAARPVEFGAIATAVLERRRLRFTSRGRHRDAASSREVSPQRVVHYRDNWYLDAYCHGAEALRVFAVDRIVDAVVGEDAALDLNREALDAQLAGAYGIYAGPARHVARLLFSSDAARWVADETWHPAQVGQYRTDGHYELSVPYGDARELIGDILRHGANVRVLGPKRLAQQVRVVLAQALAHYEPDTRV